MHQERFPHLPTLLEKSSERNGKDWSALGVSHQPGRGGCVLLGGRRQTLAHAEISTRNPANERGALRGHRRDAAMFIPTCPLTQPNRPGAKSEAGFKRKFRLI